MSAPSFAIPHVFVIPPDDDLHTQPYQCFDASHSNPTPTIQYYQHVQHRNAHDTQPTHPSILRNMPPPTFHRNVNNTEIVMPRKRYSTYIPSSDPNDSVEVVEIIKVRRRDIVDLPPPPDSGGSSTKHHAKAPSFSLRSRTWKAFSSLKGSAKSSSSASNAKPNAQEIFQHTSPTSVHSEEFVNPEYAPDNKAKGGIRCMKSTTLGPGGSEQKSSLRRRTSHLARQSSISLSALFQSPKPSPPPPTSPTFDESFSQLPLPDESYDPPPGHVLGYPLQKCPSRSSSPTPSASASLPRPSHNQTRRKLSMVGLQKLFSFSNAGPSPTSPPPPSPPIPMNVLPPKSTIIPPESPICTHPQCPSHSLPSNEDPAAEESASSFESILPPELVDSTTTSSSSPVSASESLGPMTPVLTAIPTSDDDDNDEVNHVVDELGPSLSETSQDLVDEVISAPPPSVAMIQPIATKRRSMQFFSRRSRDSERALSTRASYDSVGVMQNSDSARSVGTNGTVGTAGTRSTLSTDADDDENLEMRLDSLHFDDLSFDLDAF